MQSTHHICIYRVAKKTSGQGPSIPPQPAANTATVFPSEHQDPVIPSTLNGHAPPFVPPSHGSASTHNEPSHRKAPRAKNNGNRARGTGGTSTEGPTSTNEQLPVVTSSTAPIQMTQGECTRRVNRSPYVAPHAHKRQLEKPSVSAVADSVSGLSLGSEARSSGYRRQTGGEYSSRRAGTKGSWNPADVIDSTMLAGRKHHHIICVLISIIQ